MSRDFVLVKYNSVSLATPLQSTYRQVLFEWSSLGYKNHLRSIYKNAAFFDSIEIYSPGRVLNAKRNVAIQYL